MATQSAPLQQECVRLAQALEGLAAALRQGTRVAERDMEAAALAANWLWQAGPAADPVHARDFGAARGQLLRFMAAAAGGSLRDCAECEAAAGRMAQNLRWMAHAAMQGPARAPPAAASDLVGRLRVRFSRFPKHPAAA